MFKNVAFLLLAALPAHASGTFTCKELERVALAEGGSMRPMYEGRSLTFTWAESGFSGDGVFYHDTYEITPLGENGFRALAEDSDRSDLFRFEDGILMHAAIVKYRSEPSIQSQVFRCEPVD
ncbi:MAG: hypothetical protein P8J02_11065 [Yoonia sp.]|nr:hypothetical protein [Yoonia sp.]